MTGRPEHDSPVHLIGDEFGFADASLEALQAFALAHARTHFQGRDVVNVETGWVIGFGRRGLNKTLNHGARREHVLSIAALPALLVRARLVLSAPNRDADEARNVPFVHTLSASLRIGVTLYAARLIVKETNVGFRFYDHDLTHVTLR